MNFFTHNLSVDFRKTTLLFIFLLCSIISCSPKPKVETNEIAEPSKPLSRKLERSILSSSKKYELQIYSSENPGCSDQPSSAYDGDSIKRAMLCEFRIVDMGDKKVKYEVSLSEDKKSDAELFQIDPKKSTELARFMITGDTGFISEIPNIIIYTADSKIKFNLDSESMISTESRK
ncbi:hypothetical protein EHQ52_12140 [Leptospira koniambonensis]|uniref:Uncharacterized protein n=1 Tax=Leptospira koniambonensis TaxID=2484950 RepID=A0A4R9J981_9LEPT|nr:hypothetical protein [Leptospira koniambonensis]TGL35220.1 hypothetical protein EHQ52_12140 [Leptospira koniambonensis]